MKHIKNHLFLMRLRGLSGGKKAPERVTVKGDSILDENGKLYAKLSDRDPKRQLRLAGYSEKDGVWAR